MNSRYAHFLLYWLVYLGSVVKDYLDSFFAFYYYALEHLTDQLIVELKRLVFQNICQSGDFIYL